jgi:hypothetical protein
VSQVTIFFGIAPAEASLIGGRPWVEPSLPSNPASAVQVPLWCSRYAGEEPAPCI